MDKKLFDKFTKIVYNECGIVLNESKHILLENRIRPRLKFLGLNSEKEYIKYLENDKTDSEIFELINSVSTNVTSFYRESEHFVFLEKFVKKMQKSGLDNFRIWCSASSVGMEPYTIAFTMFETLGSSANFKLLATDVSTKVLKEAILGSYPEEKVGDVPKHILNKYFDKIDNRFVVKDFVKSKITFARLNLIHTPYPMKGNFDIIFCRNVLIYFDERTKKDIIYYMANQLKFNGILITSHSENVSGLTDRFSLIKASIYSRIK